MNDDRALIVALRIWGRKAVARTTDMCEVGYFRAGIPIIKGRGVNFEDAFHDAFQRTQGTKTHPLIAIEMKAHVAVYGGNDFYHIKKKRS